MSIFYTAYFIKAPTSTDEIENIKNNLKRKFSKVDIMEGSEWIVCDFGDDYCDGVFEPRTYLTLDISQEFGEVIFTCLDTRNDQMEYEHSQNGHLLRKLSWLTDGCQCTWACVEGEKEHWEDDIIFVENESLRFLGYMEDDLTPEQFSQKKAEIQAICAEKRYVIDDIWPYIDATVVINIQEFFGIKMPIW